MLNIPCEIIDSFKENKRRFMIIFLIFISFMILINGCERINDKIGLEDDNIVEEVTETVVQVETGIDVDLTPRSPE